MALEQITPVILSIATLWLALCLVPAFIAAHKYRSGTGFFLLSLFFSPIIGAIVALIVMPDYEAMDREMKKDKTV